MPAGGVKLGLEFFCANGHEGVLRIAEGDQNHGTALLEEAAALFAASGRPLDAARCRATAA